MILLDSVTKSLEVVLAGAVTTSQLPFVVTVSDYDHATQGTPLLWVGTFPGYTSSTTAVALAPAPTSSALRKVRQILLQNADTVAATATIRVNDNGFFSSKFVVTLQPGDHFHYIEGAPVKVFDKNGNTKQNWGGVTSVTNVDGSHTIAPTTGAVISSLNTAHANTWTAKQTFGPNLITSPFGSGSGNEAFGASAGLSSASGSFNTALGNTAGGALTSGFNNHFEGYQAGKNVTTGHDLVLVGYQAGPTIVTARGNVIIGASADMSADTELAVGIGWQSLVYYRSIAIGQGAQATGQQGVTIGQGATCSKDSSIIIGGSNSITASSAFTIGNGNTVSASGTQCFGASITISHADCFFAGSSMTSDRTGEFRFTQSNNSTTGTRLGATCTSATIKDRKQWSIDGVWVVQTDATRTGRMTLGAFDYNSGTSQREAVRCEADGSAARLGFFATTAVVQQTGDIGDALSTYGLCTSPSLKVANGGTGDASFTAYAVVCGGTGSTTALQSVAALGSAGDVLTSNGAGALPTFQTPTSILRRALAVSVTTTSGTMANLVHLGLTVASSTRYTGILVLIANNTVAGDGIQVDFNGGTATVTNFSAGFIGTPPNAGIVYGTITTTALGTALTITTASTGNAYYMIAITVLVNAGGTFIPRWSAVAPTTGTASAITGSWIGLDTTTNG